MPQTDKWRARCRELRQWVCKHGRLPVRKAASKKEASLAAWLSATYTKKFKEKVLTAEQLKQLRGVPGMRVRLMQWRSGAGKPVKWDSRCDDLRRWVAKHGRLPRRTASDQEEQSLSTWLSAASIKLRGDALTPEQRVRLERVAGVSVRIRKCLADAASPRNWVARCDEFVLWASRHQRLPRRNSDDARERTLAAWLSSRQQLHKRGELGGEQLRNLMRAPGMEERLAQWGAVSKATADADGLRALRKRRRESLSARGGQSKQATKRSHKRRVGRNVATLRAPRTTSMVASPAKAKVTFARLTLSPPSSSLSQPSPAELHVACAEVVSASATQAIAHTPPSAPNDESPRSGSCDRSEDNPSTHKLLGASPGQFHPMHRESAPLASSLRLEQGATALSCCRRVSFGARTLVSMPSLAYLIEEMHQPWRTAVEQLWSSSQLIECDACGEFVGRSGGILCGTPKRPKSAQGTFVCWPCRR
mmetsp:Transcript_9998/g.26535  ORF Transcript_9998/g.26535 Transcript_9998/m.26535 type:complete len:477 (+) Transcript_9998:67-1497(+)